MCLVSIKLLIEVYCLRMLATYQKSILLSFKSNNQQISSRRVKFHKIQMIFFSTFDEIAHCFFLDFEREQGRRCQDGHHVQLVSLGPVEAGSAGRQAGSYRERTRRRRRTCE